MKTGKVGNRFSKDHIINSGLTAAPSVVSQQGPASHSVGKAIVEIFIDLGYDWNQEKTNNGHAHAVQSDGSTEEFDNTEIPVEFQKKGES